MTTGQIKQAEDDPIAEAPVEGASRQALPRWIWLCLAAGVLVLGFVIYTGIHARATAESNLVQATDESSLPTVAVVHPNPQRLSRAGDRASRQRHGVHRHPDLMRAPADISRPGMPI